MNLVWWLKQMLLLGFGGFVVFLILKIEKPAFVNSIIVAIAILALCLWFIEVVLPRLT